METLAAVKRTAVIPGLLSIFRLRKTGVCNHWLENKSHRDGSRDRAADPPAIGGQHSQARRSSAAQSASSTDPRSRRTAPSRIEAGERIGDTGAAHAEREWRGHRRSPGSRLHRDGRVQGAAIGTGVHDLMPSIAEDSLRVHTSKTWTWLSRSYHTAELSSIARANVAAGGRGFSPSICVGRRWGERMAPSTGRADQAKRPTRETSNGSVLAGAREIDATPAFDGMRVVDRPMLLLQDRPSADRYPFEMRAHVFESVRRHARQNAIENRERGGGNA